MAEIYLMRHGQASFGHENYDQLSDLGAQQSEHTGQRWRHLQSIDHVVCGTMQRHQETCQHFARGFGELPEATIDAAFDEYDYMDVLAGSFAEITDRATLLEILQAAEHPEREFARRLHQACLRWVNEEGEYAEPFALFCERVKGGLQRVSEQTEPGQRAIVFTSGGVISSVCLQTMEIVDQNFFTLNRAMCNASISALRKHSRGLYMMFWNNYGHLMDNSEMITMV